MVWDEPTVEERTLAAEDRAIMFLAQHRRLRVLLLLLLATGAALGWVALVAMFVNHNR